MDIPPVDWLVVDIQLLRSAYTILVPMCLGGKGNLHTVDSCRCLQHAGAMHTGAVLPRYIRRADTFKRVAETRPRPANVVGKGRFSLTDFLPGV